MKRRARAFLILCAPVFVLSSALGPQRAASEPALDETQLTGQRLFNQSCRVCHTKPQLTSPVNTDRCCRRTPPAGGTT